MNKLPKVAEKKEALVNARAREIVPIRTEQYFSSLPFHCLDTNRQKKKKKETRDSLKLVIKAGDTEIRWVVTANPRYGMPGNLAYKLDKLLVDRIVSQFDEVPNKICLGSERDIARKIRCTRRMKTLDEGMDTEENISLIEYALKQNSGVMIEATSLPYKTKEKKKSKFSSKVAFHKYAVYTQGDELPDGKTAKEITLWIYEPYRQFLNQVVRRPLDYSYLMELKPLAQRFYELVSPKVYAAIKNRNPCARYSYVEFCARAPQMRYIAAWEVRKQMEKIIGQHIDHKYIESWELRKEQHDDFSIIVRPGERAYLEFDYFSHKGSVAKVRPAVSIENGEESADLQCERAKEIVRKFHQKFRNISLKTVASDEVKIILEELNAHSEEEVDYWLAYAKRESERTKYPVSTVKGILKYREEAYDLFAREKEERETRKSREEAYGRKVLGEKERKKKEEKKKNDAVEARWAEMSEQQRAELVSMYRDKYRRFLKDRERLESCAVYGAKEHVWNQIKNGSS